MIGLTTNWAIKTLSQLGLMVRQSFYQKAYPADGVFTVFAWQGAAADGGYCITRGPIFGQDRWRRDFSDVLRDAQEAKTTKCAHARDIFICRAHRGKWRQI